MDSKTSAEFYKKAQNPTIGSENEKDLSPEKLAQKAPVVKTKRTPWPLDIGITHDAMYDFA
jgi:hypothetical protein